MFCAVIYYRIIGNICTVHRVNHDIHVAFNSCIVSLKMTRKSSVIYFVRYCNTGLLLVSNGKYCVI